MISRSWLRRSAPVCAIISLLAAGRAAAGVPAVVLVDPADAPQWEALTKDAGWRVITRPASGAVDERVQALAAAVEEAIRGGVDPARVYLAGRGASAAAVFYTVARAPDLWAAAIAIDGSPQAAVETGRIFAANFTHVPVLWVSRGPADQAMAAKLKAAGLNLEWRSADGLTDRAILDWLSQYSREAFPAAIDCETNAPAFARCYWIQMSRFDPQERNDLLPSTRLENGAGAVLNLGGFSYRPDDPGPGVAVAALPDHYDGPLKKGDRIVELEGRPLADARAFIGMMAKYTESRGVVATVLRGKERIRMETRVLLPRREAMVTARVKAEFLPAEREIQIATRTVSELRVTVPPEWAQDSTLVWNGLVLEKIAGPGCYLLTEEKELLHAAPCR